MNTFRNRTLWILALVAAAGAGAAPSLLSQSLHTPSAEQATRTADDLSVAFRNVAREALPAVVWIEAHATTHVRGEAADSDEAPADPGSPGEELFRRFFQNDPRFRDFMQENPAPVEGHGSGFIIDADGVILTNSHVVEGASHLIVHFHDGSEMRAESWIADPRSDVAIVRVKTDQPLPVVALGDSDAMQIGDWVLAAGNPFDVGVTVTAGIISATGRGPGINERESYLQTDAAINPGNSGGPLLNLRGEVVGINTAISTSSGGYDGVGFAIPAKMVRWVSDQLIQHGEVRRAYLGVALQEMSNDLRRQFHVPLGQGALVNQVYPDTPASKAGFEEGDVVVEFNARKIGDRSQLQGIVEMLDVGRTYPAVVLRDGKRVTLSVQLEQMPGDFTAALQRRRPGAAEPEPVLTTEFDALGLQTEKVTPALIKQLQLSERATGIVVTAVKAGSAAAEVGLRPGDVIQKVGSKTIATPDEFRAAVEGLSLDTGIALLVLRGNTSQFVVLKAE